MPGTSPPRRSRHWIVFFVILFVLSSVAIIVPLVYNLSIQLRPEQLADARRRWQENGSPNYDLQYLVEIKQKSAMEAEKNEYVVKVRDGRVVFLVENGEPVYIDPSFAALAGPQVLAVSSVDPGRYGMAALFDEIEAALREDESSGQRNFTTAQFDPVDGHPKTYRRSVRATKVGLEWHIKLTRIDASPPSSPDKHD